jgi:hypothetical protein
MLEALLPESDSPTFVFSPAAGQRSRQQQAGRRAQLQLELFGASGFFQIQSGQMRMRPRSQQLLTLSLTRTGPRTLEGTVVLVVGIQLC